MPSPPLIALARRVALCLAALLAAVGTARADDAIVLTNGNEIRGRILSDDEKGVKIDIGGGTMTFARDRIAEVRREKPAAATTGGAPVDPAANLAAARDEFAVIYVDGARRGTRSLRVRKDEQGFVFDEETVFLDAAGKVAREVRTTERSNAQYLPISFQVRETVTKDGAPSYRSALGEFRTGRLYVTFTTDGEREKTEERAPTDARFPFGARELFLRESRALDGKLDTPVYDVSTRKFDTVIYLEGGERKVRVGETVADVRVIVRRRGSASADHEWVRSDLSSVISGLGAPGLGTALLLATDAKTAGAVRAGAVAANASGNGTGNGAGEFPLRGNGIAALDAAAQMRFVDPNNEWTIGKPDPSWTFGQPTSRAEGRRLALRTDPEGAQSSTQGATVELSAVESASETSKPMTAAAAAAAATAAEQRAVEALQRMCRTAFSEFRVTQDGAVERRTRMDTSKPAERVWWMQGRFQKDGKAMDLVARIVRRQDRVYRLVATCPADQFKQMRADLDTILDSFAAK